MAALSSAMKTIPDTGAANATAIPDQSIYLSVNVQSIMHGCLLEVMGPTVLAPAAAPMAEKFRWSKSLRKKPPQLRGSFTSNRPRSSFVRDLCCGKDTQQLRECHGRCCYNLGSAQNIVLKDCHLLACESLFLANRRFKGRDLNADSPGSSRCKAATHNGPNVNKGRFSLRYEPS